MTRALVVVVALFAAGVASAGEPESVRLERGDVVVWTEKVAGSETPVGYARGVIDAPPAAVWAVVEACEDYSKTMPRILKSAVVKREGAVRFCKVTADMPFPAPDLESLTRAEGRAVDGGFVRTWRLVEGDYKINEGSFSLMPYGDGSKTLATYRIHVQPNLPLPDGIVRAAQKGSLPDVIHNLRKRFAKQ